MKLGLGLYPRLLTVDNLRFARQVGATHIVAHLPNWTTSGVRGVAPGPRGESPLWGVEELTGLRRMVEAEDLALEAIENFEPAHWHDVLLDGPRRDEQLAGLKTIVRNLGAAGIPIMGYNFSLAGVWGRTRGPWARGGAVSVGYVEAEAPPQTPIPNGTVWNTVYDPAAPPGDIGTVSSEQLWARLEHFLRELVPVAEEAGVRLAAHPDDPPLETLRGTARLVYKPELYGRLLEIVPSRANACEFCLGTIAEMRGEMDPYAALETYAAADRLAYIHFRNVVGTVPNYREVFLDEGDVDMLRALRILYHHGYGGVLIPDHTPSVACDAPWHAGMAWALGYMRAALTLIEGGA